MVNIAAVDLFCGAGGLTHGLLNAEINVVAGFDIEESCRFAYEANNPGARFINQDVSALDASKVNDLFPDDHVKLLAGCAPCQPFSTYSQGRDARKDKKWPLLYEFARLIGEIEPELVTMENVPDVTKHEVYHDFARELVARGYKVWADKVFCPQYGLPQVRKRHVLLASRLGDIELIEPTHSKAEFVSVQDVIGSMPSITAGEQCSDDELHISAGLSELNLQRIKTSKPGGTWRDWPEDLRAACHQQPSGKTYSGVYARMEWDKPSPTITTQCYGYGNGRFGHPEQDRAISLREAALLQSFPVDYEFSRPDEKINMSAIGVMIGNAVPVVLGEAIGKSLKRHVS